MRLNSPAIFVLACGSLFALPPFVAIPDRVKKADAIVLAEVLDVRERAINPTTISVNVRVNVQETLKGAPEQHFSLAFLVFPQTLESNLKKAPDPGRYVVFLQRKKTDGGEALVLFWPHPFAFLPYSEENLIAVKKALKQR